MKTDLDLMEQLTQQHAEYLGAQFKARSQPTDLRELGKMEGYGDALINLMETIATVNGGDEDLLANLADMKTSFDATVSMLERALAKKGGPA